MSVLRLSGLASGMDTETMIKQLMQAERAPVNRLNQKKQILNWQRDSYREINRSLLDLRTAASDMILSKNYTAKITSSSDPSKISVTASTIASVGSLTIDNISQLASASSVSLNTTPNQSNTTTLADSNLFVVDANGKINVQIKTVSNDGKNIESTISMDSNQKISDLVSSINAQTNLEINAIYNEITGKLVLTKSTTGKLNQVGPDISVIDINTGNEKVNSQTPFLGQEGKNSKYKVGGQELEQKSNTFVQNGLTISLNDISNTSITITTKLDTQTNFDSIKKFVDKYNALIEKMNSKVNEEKYRDYKPLTDDQRKELSDDEIKKWEEKAMSGILHNDSFLREGMSEFRSVISSKIDTGYSYQSESGAISLSYMSQIGITTTSDFRDGGKLQINESKLKEMLEKNPEGVYRLFTADALPPTVNQDGTISPNVNGIDGFVRQIQDFATSIRSRISQVAGVDGAVANSYRLGKSLIDVQKNILSLEDKLKTKENNYYRRFAAMEKAMNQANSQSASLSSYLGQ